MAQLLQSSDSIYKLHRLYKKHHNGRFSASVPRQLPHLGDDLLWLIFVRTDPKTAVTCRTLCKRLSFLLKSDLFVKENYKENEIIRKSVMVGVGPPPNDDVSQWFMQADVNGGRQDLFRVPQEINNYERYTVVGSDKRIVCMRYSMGGANSALLIWNPLMRTHRYATDEAGKYQHCDMNVYAFGFLKDSLHYRILNVFKFTFINTTMCWNLYDSVKKDWEYHEVFHTTVKKIGGPYVVDEGTVHWIGWDGFMVREPHRIVMFCLLKRRFSEFLVPDRVHSQYHSLIRFNGGVRFMGHRTNSFTQTVAIWRYTIIDGDHLTWDKKFVVGGMEIPYSPSFFVGKDLVSIIEVRQNGKGSSNDDDRTDIVISKLKFLPRRREHLIHQSWQDHVHVKTVTLYTSSLFKV
ncbi:hypothetical protein PIB30_025992 [Stylosanthes scabra]|uniref:F-box associated beta-propeller type 1 domain-containing protein n=1 Tax=Stylosanthes scabra TaxID=79078 RepID=A0ABU6U9G7_9FABA|nr:hypothetical protein [Stylosanthes scabra]